MPGLPFIVSVLSLAFPARSPQGSKPFCYPTSTPILMPIHSTCLAELLTQWQIEFGQRSMALNRRKSGEFSGLEKTKGGFACLRIWLP